MLETDRVARRAYITSVIVFLTPQEAVEEIASTEEKDERNIFTAGLGIESIMTCLILFLLV